MALEFDSALTSYKIYPSALALVILSSSEYELGLSEDAIVMKPNYYHQDLSVDNYGPYATPDVLSMMFDCTIEMNLVFYDPDTLNSCINFSIGGDTIGTMGAAGKLLGLNRISGRNFIGLKLSFKRRKRTGSITFPSCYLTQMPVTIPLGTKRSITKVIWKAIPYCGKIEKGEGPGMKSVAVWEGDGGELLDI